MSYPLARAGLGTLDGFVAGQRKAIRLNSGVRTFYIDLLIRCTATVTVAAVTNLRNMGSAASIFSEIGIRDAGAADWVLTGMEHLYSSQMVAPQNVQALGTRMGTATGAYLLEEMVRLWFAQPFGANPEETPYIETDINKPLELFATLDPLAAAGGTLSTAGPATVAVTLPRIDVVQHYDLNRDRRALYRPHARALTLTITAAPPGANIDGVEIVTNDRLRAIGIIQSSPEVGILNDVINSLSFKGTRRMIIGDGLVPWRVLTRIQPFDFGGLVTGGGFGTAPLGDSFLGLNLQPWGRLGLTWDPKDDSGWRIRFNAQTSAAAGATTSQIKVILYELETVAGVTVAPRNFKP